MAVFLISLVNTILGLCPNCFSPCIVPCRSPPMPANRSTILYSFWVGLVIVFYIGLFWRIGWCLCYTFGIMVNIFSVAGYILSCFPAGLSVAKLYKLLFLCQVLSLAGRGERLFDVSTVVFRAGPEYRVLEDSFGGRDRVLFSEWKVGEMVGLSEDSKSIVDFVCRSYGFLSGFELVLFIEGVNGFSDGYSIGDVIPDTVMKDWFEERFSGSGS